MVAPRHSHLDNEREVARLEPHERQFVLQKGQQTGAFGLFCHPRMLEHELKVGGEFFLCLAHAGAGQCDGGFDESLAAWGGEWGSGVG